MTSPNSSNTTKTQRQDAILPMTNDYMQQIVLGQKTYEFRRYRIAPTVRRIWFYLTAPFSHIAYICEIDPAHTRNEGDEELPEDGLGNKEFNERHVDWDRYDYAYRVRSVYRIRIPISLKQLKTRYGVKGAPRGLVYVPDALLVDVVWNEQERVLPVSDASRSLKRPSSRVEDPPSSMEGKRQKL